MKTRLWLAGSVIAVWQLLSSPQLFWTLATPWFGLACFLGTVACINVALKNDTLEFLWN